MRIFLVRHGEAEFREGDEVLTQGGHAQAKAVCTRLREYPIRYAYVSDLTRARQTAAYSSIDSEVTPQIREIYRVIVGGMPKPGTPVDREARDRDNAERFWERLMAMDADVVVFTHANLIRYYLMKVLGMPKAGLYDKLVIDNASVTILDKDEMVKVRRVNACL